MSGSEIYNNLVKAINRAQNNQIKDREIQIQ